jgi:hypothetical protein
MPETLGSFERLLGFEISIVAEAQVRFLLGVFVKRRDGLNIEDVAVGGTFLLEI